MRTETTSIEPDNNAFVLHLSSYRVALFYFTFIAENTKKSVRFYDLNMFTLFISNSKLENNLVILEDSEQDATWLRLFENSFTYTGHFSNAYDLNLLFVYLMCVPIQSFSIQYTNTEAKRLSNPGSYKEILKILNVIGSKLNWIDVLRICILCLKK